ncbi:MutS-related protein [Marinifilum sp.]|uniref:MutS-related protein n=1 Tax=Marinifilum sp. TaxID=2033137 RepID=UPI003BAD7401
MDFVTDKQTLQDLNILGQFKNNSIFSLFNQTITSGGGRLLERMFNNPYTELEPIERRKQNIAFFEKLNTSLPFTEKEFDEVENYLRNTESKSRIVAAMNISRTKFMNFIAQEKEYLVIREGLERSIVLLKKFRETIKLIVSKSNGTPFYEKALKLQALLERKELLEAYELEGISPLPYKNVFRFDYIFRGLLNDEMEDLINEIYSLDVFMAVSDVARKRGFKYAKALDKEQKVIDLKGVFHPAIPNAVDNDIKIEGNKNVFFLTGANMAGKSTFMKSFSVAVYLAHMGFPVPAKEMTFSVHDGIYTSINVPDDLAQGYSHFYAEVLRVKHVAEEVASNKQLVIIFDELFKGTNVKDAYDGTVSIVDAFSKRLGTFIISTHIMEAGQTLQKSNDRLFFKYLPTVMKGAVPTYPYKLADGITDDRHGMIIIENEKILETIRGGKS